MFRVYKRIKMNNHEAAREFALGKSVEVFSEDSN